ncbi:MAG: glycoside hydrolase family 3 N-terminal domain-containing protein, partial [Phycisphaerae bacterium]|nr:glycoside hydrolase family 3 N-terminal domain-containing protein [Phycisphaerae bacterium]
MTKVSQLTLTGIALPHLTTAIRSSLQRLQPGGIVLFLRNVVTTTELVRLTRELRNLLSPHALIAVDQEGGRVARLRSPFTEWPPMRTFG